jgi:hypothetical protein
MVLFYLLEKWVFPPISILLGMGWLYLAYQKRHLTEPFRIGDLFANRRLYDKTKQQLLFEALLFFVIAVAGIFIFFGPPSLKPRLARPVSKSIEATHQNRRTAFW